MSKNLIQKLIFAADEKQARTAQILFNKILSGKIVEKIKLKEKEIAKELFNKNNK